MGAAPAVRPEEFSSGSKGISRSDEFLAGSQVLKR